MDFSIKKIGIFLQKMNLFTKKKDFHFFIVDGLNLFDNKKKILCDWCRMGLGFCKICVLLNILYEM